MIGRDEKTVPKYEADFLWGQVRAAVLAGDLEKTLTALEKVYPTVERFLLVAQAEMLVKGASRRDAA